MNRELLESQWTQIRDILREKFSNLTDEDIRQINGRYEQLVAKLQQRYGYSREEAEDRIKSWNFDRLAGQVKGPTAYEERTYREDKSYSADRLRREEESKSVLKWLLGLGLPILLIAAYLLSPTRVPETTSAPTAAPEQLIIETPADRMISSGIRNTLISQQNFGAELQNVRITTHDGIVTLSGTVPSVETRDFIINTAQNYLGVRQVINNLQVR